MNKATPAQLEKIGAIAADLVQPHQLVGLGSGKAALAFVRALGARCRNGKLPIRGVPTSLLTEQVARESGIPLATLDEVESLDITVDGADEVDPALNLIKGGGGNLTREKVIASITKKFVIVVGEEKIVQQLGTSFPVFIELIEFAKPVVTRKLQSMGATIVQRTNADGSNFLTDNKNPYFHVTFHHGGSTLIPEPAALDRALHNIPGILETGLFIGNTSEVIVAKFDDSVQRLRAR